MFIRSKAPRVYRWDLDKTYLESHFDSFRELVRVPFEKAEQKIAVPGVASLIKGLVAKAEADGAVSRVYFLSASPPQIGNAIRSKLELDGIRHDGITFKNQVANLVRGRFDALREQIGYKLDRLLDSAFAVDRGTREFLFGDDWESDPFVYSLYADIVAGHLGDRDVLNVLNQAGVHRHYIAGIREKLDRRQEDAVDGHSVEGIFILRQRPAAEYELAAFGERLVWFDNYFECGLALYARGLLGEDGVAAVALSMNAAPADLARSYEAAARRPGFEAGRFGAPRRRMRSKKLIESVPGGGPVTRLITAARRAVGMAPAPVPAGGSAPDYAALVARWSRRGRKESAKLDAAERSMRDTADARDTAEVSET